MRSSRPLATSQSLTVLSSLPEASICPSGENATELTRIGMSAEGAQLAPARHVPELDGVVALPEASICRPARTRRT